MDVPDHVPPRCHISLHGLSLLDIHDGGKEEGLSMLASEIPRDDFIEICKMGLAVLMHAS